MFIFNIKINKSKLFKIFFISSVILLLIIICIVIYKVFSGADRISKVDTCIQTGVLKIPATNYTNILKNAHENIDSYIGKKINFIGYVYRVYDLNDNQFILARDMIINSKNQTVVVGFLCECDTAKNFENNTWVEITGEITKGNYHGDMPIVKISEIKKIDKPTSDEYVYPPDENYIPTTT